MTFASSPVGRWMVASRPATLPAAIVPVAVGSALAGAEGAFQPFAALAALVGALAIQLGTNFHNDASDFERGADNQARLGPARAVQAGLISVSEIRRGAVLSFAVAVLAGAYLSIVGGPWIVAIGVASIASGLAYTGGPLPLAYAGLGDLFVLLFFGVVAVGGSVFVQAGFIPVAAWPHALAVGATCTAILVVNNLRDRATDAAAKKRTLAARFGRRFSVFEYVALLALAFGCALFAREPLPLLLLPYAGWVTFRLCTRDGRALNPVLKDTARLHLSFGALLCLGILT